MTSRWVLEDTETGDAIIDDLKELMECVINSTDCQWTLYKEFRPLVVDRDSGKRYELDLWVKTTEATIIKSDGNIEISDLLGHDHAETLEDLEDIKVAIVSN
jgi:hypothetical protein